MKQFSDWMIVGAFTFGVGIVGSLAGQVNGGLVGSTTGGIVGTFISSTSKNKRQLEIEIKLQQVEKHIKTQEELIKLNEELVIIERRLELLQKEQTALAPVEGQYQEKLAALKQIHQNLTVLKQQEQELENRIAVINQKKPDLSNLEKLQQQIEGFKIEKSGLEGQINALSSQVKSLESQKTTLQNVESELATKQVNVDNLNLKVEELQSQSQQLEQRATEVELLRVTYDGLLGQKENFEIRVNQLKPEIERLEAEKQRILQAIQESQNDYYKVEELRRKLHNLKIEIRDKESELRQLEREIENLQRVKAELEENIARLQREKQELEDIIRRFKGEIAEIENSAKLALQSLRENLWTQLPDSRLQLEEKEFIADFINTIQSQGLTFSTRVINAFHTSLKVQDISALAILAGISGTGKSELPQRYAHYIGAQLLTLAVQPRWDSPQDLQGFYNYVEKKFKPTDLMRGLYQYNHDPKMQDRIVIVLLDEMNLARVEYYFSEFLSKLESRRNDATYLEIDVGSLRISENERRLQIPKEFLFVGTMNEDETTQTLSDKVLDRANVLTFGRPQNLKLRQENQNSNTRNDNSKYLPYSHFKEWMKEIEPNSEVVKKVKEILNNTNEVMEKMGHPFAHRVYQAVTQYVVNYPGVDDINSHNFKFAIADQFGQKLLPKLRSVMVDEASEELEELKTIISEIGDQPLIAAFEKARKGRYGQFNWQGLVYEDEQIS
jgi:predicted  nucleic acid-binding Zn-ribbon protein